MARFNARINYIDGFAGPGKYLGGEDGSPLIALKVAKLFLDNGTLKPQQMTMLLIERDKERHDLLTNEIRALQESDAAYRLVNIVVARTDYTAAMDQVWALLEHSKATLAPTFAFIDPFGVSGTPYEHIAKLLSFDKTEVLINFMYEEANRFLDTPEFKKHLDAFFGNASWKSLKEISKPDDRRAAMIEMFKRGLHDAGARYVQVFEMRNRQNRTDYLLFFATRSDKGLEAMKEAMWRVDQSGRFSFSDYTYAKGPMLIEPSPDYRVLQEQLRERFPPGTEVSIKELRLFIFAETSFFHYKAEALKPLEQCGLIEVVRSSTKRRRAWSYPDDVRISFR